MSLRTRLALFFVVITVLPLVVAVLVLQQQVDRGLAEREDVELSGGVSGAIAALDERRLRAGDLATELALDDAASVIVEGEPASAQDWLEESLEARGGGATDLAGRADAVLLADAEGDRLAAVLLEPDVDEPAAWPDADDLAGVAVGRVPTPPGALVAIRDVQGTDGATLGYLLSAVWVDDALLAALADGGIHLAALDDDGVLAASEPVPADLAAAVAAARPGEQLLTADEAGVRVALGRLAGDADEPSTTIASWGSTAAATSPWPVAGVLLVVAVLVAAGIGWVLADSVVAPVRSAADAARAVAAGDLSQRMEPAGGRELTDLAAAFNQMAGELERRLAELAASQDELRSNLARLGVTLSSSLNLDRTLAVAVETAMAALGAERAALLLYTPERDRLYVKVGRGLGDSPWEVDAESGRLGAVAASGDALRLPPPPGGATAAVAPLAPGEPSGHCQLAVPLDGRRSRLGVLTVIRDADAKPFADEDLTTLSTFAAQTSVAIENVLLHQEARRLSVTDTLTGLWNFRYFRIQAEREVASAARYQRDLALAIVDLDHFKEVNDEHGHQVGDAVLAEVARRMREATRAPDVVARYGGEEFVVLLPGTDLAGAELGGERLREAIASEPIVPPRQPDGTVVEPLEVTCSVGVSAFPGHGQTVAALLRTADAALYRAKSAGRDRVVAAEPVP